VHRYAQMTGQRLDVDEIGQRLVNPIGTQTLVLASDLDGPDIDHTNVTISTALSGAWFRH